MKGVCGRATTMKMNGKTIRFYFQMVKKKGVNLRIQTDERKQKKRNWINFFHSKKNES